jgi:RNA polymerase sigma-70 factor, ECF subfamily
MIQLSSSSGRTSHARAPMTRSPRRMSTPAEHDEDRDLVRAALASDPEAVARLVARLGCIPRILALLNGRMGRVFSGEDMRDLEQETLATLWPRMRSYTGQAALETWVYGFCFNGFMNGVRKARRHRPVGALQEQDLARSEPGAGLADLELLLAALERLEPREASVIRLKYFDDLTFEEIGRRLVLSPNTAKTAFYRGMRRLEELLRGRDREEEP